MTAPRKMIGFGTKLYTLATSTASTTSYFQLGGLLGIDGPNTKTKDVDTTVMDSTTPYDDFQASSIDPGEASFTLCYASTDSSNKKLGTLLKNRTITKFKITWPSTAVAAETFTGFVNSMGRSIEKDSMIQRKVGIRVTGAPGYPST